MDVREVAGNLREYLQANSDCAIAEKYRRYFVEGYHPYGVDPTLLKAKVSEISRSGINLDEALLLGDMLVSSGRYEEGQIAISLLKHFNSDYTKDTFARLGGWFDIGIGNWAHDDGLCLDVLSVFLIRRIVAIGELKDWAQSGLKYKRRAVPVTLIKAVDKPFGADEVIESVKPLMTDREKVVQQGVGWLLREIWKKHPEPVEALLAEFKQTGARTIFQYATEKMSSEQKERFRREKRAG